MKKFFSSYFITATVGACLGYAMKQYSFSEKTSFAIVTEKNSSEKSYSAEDVITKALVKIRERKPDYDVEHAMRKKYDAYLISLANEANPDVKVKELLARMGNAGGVYQMPIAERNKLIDDAAQLSAHYNFWFTKKPQEAIKWLNELHEGGYTYAGAFAFEDYLKTNDVKSLVAFSSGVVLKGHITSSILKNISERGSVTDLDWYMHAQETGMHEKIDKSFCYETGRYWPFEKRDDLLHYFQGSNAALVIDSFSSALSRDNPEKMQQGIDWVIEIFDDGQVTDDTKRSIAEKLFTKNYFLNRLAEAIPLATRLEILKKYQVLDEQNIAEHQNIVIRHIADHLVTEENDYSYQFRHGVLSAEEVFQAVLSQRPDLTSSQDELKKQVYKYLAEEDPERAASLVTGDATTQAWTKINAAKAAFFQIDPATLLKLCNSVDVNNHDDQAVGLSDAWHMKTQANIELYGNAYVQWVKNLPEGNSKQWALHGLHEVIQYKNRKMDEEIKALLK